MAEVIRMPLLSDTMKEGKIAAWLKKVGDTVKSDDVLAEVETDKATMEVMGYADGQLLYIGVEAGSSAKIDEIICIVGKPGEDISALISGGASANVSPATSAPTVVTPVAASTVSIPKELTVVTMPLLSDTMKEGKIATWIRNIGDTVKSDDVIAEVETDKATMEVIGYAEGTLLYKGAEAGNSVLVNGTLAVVGPKDFDISPYVASFASAGTQVAPAPVEPPVVVSTPVVAASNSVSNNGASHQSGGRVFASPLAKKIALEKGIDIAAIQGSGDGGRIIAKDVLTAQPSTQKSTTTSGSGSAASVTGVEAYHDVELSQMRTVIAQRLSDSMYSAPHFYLTISVEMDNLLALRKQINDSQPIKVSINDMLIKACALSLKKHPAVNSSWLGNKIRTYSHVHIGSAVAIPDGLIVPVVKFADVKTLTQIATDANELYEKAKNKKLQPSEFTGNTFTISNLGMMGIDEFTAIINPPDAAILAVGRSVPTPIVNDKGAVEVRTIMKLTLSCDHRVAIFIVVLTTKFMSCLLISCGCAIGGLQNSNAIVT
jgi:pyruvate dehydrogenase E2 component (dihydrolipoamide acetyltransferase)